MLHSLPKFESHIKSLLVGSGTVCNGFVCDSYYIADKRA